MRRGLALGGLALVAAGAVIGYYRSSYGFFCLGGVNGPAGTCERTYFHSWTGAISTALFVVVGLLFVSASSFALKRLRPGRTARGIRADVAPPD